VLPLVRWQIKTVKTLAIAPVLVTSQCAWKEDSKLDNKQFSEVPLPCNNLGTPDNNNNITLIIHEVELIANRHTGADLSVVLIKELSIDLNHNRWLYI